MLRTKAYHGSNSRFRKFDDSKARIVNDFFGGGIAYFTESLDVAKSYASTMFRRYGGERYVYEVMLEFDKIFDVNDNFTGETLKKLVGSEVETFARGARLLPLGVDKTRVLISLREGSANLTGEQVFRGMSNGMINTAEARKKLMRAGYDGLRYNGGDNMGMAKKHSVFLAYYPKSIEIKQRYIMSNVPVRAEEKQEVYTFI